MRAAGRTRPPGRFRRYWHRLAIPFTVLALLVGVTLVARAAEEPNLRDPETLVPVGAGDDGSSQLAELLRGESVAIEAVRDLAGAEQALARGDAVLFLPKPTDSGALLVRQAARSPGAHRVVLVAPSDRELALAGLPVSFGPTRWSSRAAAPGCAVPEAVAAGVAAAQRHRYSVADPEQVCYGGGLVRVRVGSAEVFVVGASDPFRNGRLGEHGNATLATGLLAARERVVWAGALPAGEPVELPAPEPGAPRRGEVDRSGGNAFGYLLAGYPPGVTAGMALAVLLALLVALARARRLGPPVREPLPVLVPAAEVVVGQGRLYQRTRGRGVALRALRAQAARTLARVLGLPRTPSPEPDALVAAVAERTGLPVGQVRHTLYGPEPASDEQLRHAVAALDALETAVTGRERGEQQE